METLNTKKKTKRAKCTLSAKIYEYGCSAPLTNEEVVNENLYQAHSYRNEWVAIERERRDSGNASVLELSAELASVQQYIESLGAHLDKIRANINIGRAKSRTWASVDMSVKADADRIKLAIKNAQSRQKEIKQRLKSDSSVKAVWAEANEVAGIKIKAARAEHFWGYYLTVEEGFKEIRKGTPPKFRRYTGEGKTGAQIQGGMSVDELLGCKNTQVQLWLTQLPNGRSKRQGKRARGLLSLRVGSDGRKPIWATVRLTLHRPLPAGCRIKQVNLLRRKVGTQSRWCVQFSVVRAETLSRPVAGTGICGIDMGFRKSGGDLRVAAWVGGDGQSGMLVLPADIIQRVHYVEGLQGIRDKAFDLCIPKVLYLRRNLPTPFWYDEATEHAHLWKDKAKLARLAVKWRDNRFSGDEFFYEIVEGWRKQDKHLLDWSSFERRAVRKYREQIYRKLAEDLSRRYAIVGIEDIDHRTFDTADKPEDSVSLPSPVRANRRIAALSILTKCIKERGVRVVEVPAAATTITCSNCGTVNTFKVRSGLIQTCSGCLTTWDRDENASMNILTLVKDQINRERSGLAN